MVFIPILRDKNGHQKWFEGYKLASATEAILLALARFSLNFYSLYVLEKFLKTFPTTQTI